MKYYFYRTVKENNINLLRPLPGQFTDQGLQISEQHNARVTRGGIKLRATYPVGTVFCSTMCEIESITGEIYYFAGDIYPILIGGKQYKIGLPEPFTYMITAFNEYRKARCSDCINYVETRDLEYKCLFDVEENGFCTDCNISKQTI